MRRIIAEDPDWLVIKFFNLFILNPNAKKKPYIAVVILKKTSSSITFFVYFYSRSLATVPLLTELCVKHIVGNFQGKKFVLSSIFNFYSFFTLGTI